MTFSLLGTARTNGTDSASTRTTEDAVGTRNTTGAKLIVVAFHGNLGSSTTVADTVGNTYTLLNLGAGSENRNRLYYCINPTTSTTHSWSVSGTSMFGFLTVSYWGNTDSVIGVDVSNTASGSGSTRDTGSVTPNYSNSLLIAVGVTSATGSSFSINGGFTIGANNSLGLESSINYGGVQAYLIQTAIAAANPTWTMPGSGNHAAGIVVFRGGDGAGAGAELAGSITLDNIDPTGTLGLNPSQLGASTLTLDNIAPTGTLGIAPGTVTTLPFSRNTGSRPTGLSGIAVAILSDDANMTRLAGATSLAQDGSGRIVYSGAGLPAFGTSVLVVTREPDGKLGLERYTVQ